MGKGPLEIFKFSLYLIGPAALTYAVVQPENVQHMLRTRPYIVYPPEAERPPKSSEEIRSYLKEAKSRNDNNNKGADGGVGSGQLPSSSSS